MANSVCWYVYMLRREDDHVFGRTLDIEGEGQRKKRRLRRIWTKQVEEDGVKVVLSREDVLC